MARSLVLGVIGILLLSVPPAYADTLEREVLQLVNQYRKTAGLAPVVLDATLSKGCREHAEYMKRNKDTSAMVGLAAHKQDPALPGATPGGAACAKAADLFPGVADLKTAVHGWMASLYHRRPMLSPALAKIGVGYAQLPDRTYMAALMFVDSKSAATKGWPVGYPAKDQTDVPLEFGNEIPDPVPGDGTGGYPFTLQFPPFDKVTNVTAKLVDGGGRAVPFHLSSPERPATSFGQYGVICVIPKEPLRPATRYVATVTATWKGETRTWSWGWKTVGLRRVDASDEAGLLAALGQPSLVRGTVKYGGMMNSATAYLTLATSKNGRYEMVSVLVPAAIWKSLRRGTPEAVRDASIEVEATPQLVQNRYLNLPVATANHLRFVPPRRSSTSER